MCSSLPAWELPVEAQVPPKGSALCQDVPSGPGFPCRHQSLGPGTHGEKLKVLTVETAALMQTPELSRSEEPPEEQGLDKRFDMEASSDV